MDLIVVDDSHSSQIDICFKEFNEYLTQIWVDIGLMDYIVVQVDAFYLKGFEAPTARKRYFQPLVKLKTSYFDSSVL